MSEITDRYTRRLAGSGQPFEVKPPSYYQALADEMQARVLTAGWDGEWFRRAYDDFSRPVSDFMTSKNLVTAPVSTTLEEAKRILQQHRIEKLPLVLIVANNQYAYSTPNSRQFACRDLSERAAGYGVEALDLDGTTIPRVALQFFIDRYIRPKHPEVGLDSVFTLPARIDTATVGDHQLILTQK